MATVNQDILDDLIFSVGCQKPCFYYYANNTSVTNGNLIGALLGLAPMIEVPSKELTDLTFNNTYAPLFKDLLDDISEH